GTGVVVAGTDVLVGGTGVFDGGAGVLVGGTGVCVGGTGVLVGGTGVFVDGCVVTVCARAVAGASQPLRSSDTLTRSGKSQFTCKTEGLLLGDDASAHLFRHGETEGVQHSGRH